MVSAHRVDALRDPSLVLHELWNELNGPDAANFPQLVSDHFERVFHSPDAFNEIPTLDVPNPPQSFPDRALVRFRAMVQDTSPSSQIYLSKSSSGALGGWGLAVDTSDDNVEHYSECTVLWTVTIPGQTLWSAAELDGPESDQERPPRQSSAPPSDSILKFSHKYPSPSCPHVGVQVKLYNRNDIDRLKSTDIVTFVGILSVDPLSTNLDSSVDVPTLHVLWSRTHPTGLLSRPYPRIPIALPSTDLPDDTASVRTELIAWIADEALGGDREAAEWVLLAIIGRVQSRNPPLLPPSLTLAHFPALPAGPSTSVAPPAQEPTLGAVLAVLLALVQTLSLSLDTLNGSAFAPESKDEDLHSGMLQLPQGSVLLASEGGVQEGKLVDRGVRNVHALQEMLAAQTLAYVFPFSQFSFRTDIACVVLASGSKSVFFKTDLTVPLNVKAEPEVASALYKPAKSISLPPPARLAAFRDLVVGARCGRVSVSEETSEHIQADFVHERQRDTGVTSEDLIRRMAVAKLYALSMHETALSPETWARAKALDARRASRMGVA